MRARHKGILWLAATTALLASAMPASALASGQGNGASGLQACVTKEHELSAVILMDESKSLFDANDKADRRIQALKGLLLQLGQLAREGSSANPANVNVLLVGFAANTNPLYKPDKSVDWMDLSSSDGSKSAQQEADSFAERDQKHWTNYTAAVAAAQSFLRDRKRQGHSGCQAVIMFTDGQPLLPHTTPRQTATALCSPGGLISSLLNDHEPGKSGIFRFAIGLGSGPFDFLRSLAIGGPGATGIAQCGGPNAQSDLYETGYFTEASTGDLYWKLGQILNDPQTPRVSGDRHFKVYEGIDHMVIEVNLGNPNQTVTLEGPRPDPVQFSNSMKNDGGELTMPESEAKVRANWVSDKILRLDVDFTGNNANASWSLKYSGGKPAGSSAIRLYASLAVDEKSIKAQLEDGLHINQQSKFKFSFVSRDGETAKAPELIARAMPKVTYSLGSTSGLDTGVVSGPDSNGVFQATIKPPADWPEGDGTLTVRSDFNVEPGIIVQPVWRAVDMKLSFPEDSGFPSVKSTSLDLGDTDGTKPLTGNIKIVASSSSSGCIWGRVVQEPAANIGLKVTGLPSSEADCKVIPKGQTATLPVTIQATKDDTDSAANAVVQVQTTAPDLKAVEPRVRTTNVQIHGQIYPRQDLAKTLGLTLLFIFLGLAIPLAILLLLNARNARFADVHKLSYMSFPVQVTEDGEVLNRDGSALSVPEDLLDPAYKRLINSSGSTDAKTISVDGLNFEAVSFLMKRPQMLFTGPIGIATVDSGQFAISQRAGVSAKSLRTRQEVALSLINTWAFRSESSAVQSSQARQPKRSIDAGTNTREGGIASASLSGTLLIIFRQFRTEEAQQLLNEAMTGLRAIAERQKRSTKDFEDQAADPPRSDSPTKDQRTQSPPDIDGPRRRRSPNPTTPDKGKPDNSTPPPPTPPPRRDVW